MQLRPTPKNIDLTKKVKYVDEFELTIMRWRYLLQTENPSEERLKELEPYVQWVSKRVYRNFSSAFIAIGYDIDDVKNVCRVHLVSYLGKFSIEDQTGPRNKFLEENSEATSEVINKKNMSNLYKFLSQRLIEAAKICACKVQSINGTPNQKNIYIGPSHIEPNSSADAYFTKMTDSEYRKTPKTPTKNKRVFETEDGRIIKIFNKASVKLNKSDYLDLFNVEPRTPEDVLEEMESEFLINKKIENKFYSLDTEKKVSFLRKFVNKNKEDDSKAAEVKVARKMIRALKNDR